MRGAEALRREEMRATLVDDALIRKVLRESRVIAVVGLSRDPSKTSRSVTSYMMGQGYQIVPINPTAETLLDQPSYPTLADLPQEVAQSVDIVDIFRPSDDLPPIVDQALTHLPNLRAIWAQLGIRNDRAAEMAERAGMTMIQDRCIRVEFARLM
jgi:predicted CoA-binding protein